MNILRSTGSCFMWSISRHSTGEENEDSTGNGNPDCTQVWDPLQGDRSDINSDQERRSRTPDTTQLNRIRVLRILQSNRLPGVRHQLETRYLDFVQRDLFEDNDYDQRTVRIQAGQENSCPGCVEVWLDTLNSNIYLPCISISTSVKCTYNHE